MVSTPEDYPYSSYGYYISSRKKDHLVHKDVILGMLSKKRSIAIKGYKDFVEKAIEEKVEDPLKDLYGGSILGGKNFMKEVLSTLKGGVFLGQEVSHRRELDAAFGVDRITDTVAGHFKESTEDVLQDRGEKRNIAIYLIKKWTSMPNKQIGDLFGGLSYSAVAKANERFSAKVKNNKALKNRVNRISNKMSYV